MKKTSYPMWDYQSYKSSFDTKKWLDAFNSLSYFESMGQNKFNEITHGWDDFEKTKFIEWMRFYQERNHLKYKKAHSYYSNGDYFLPLESVMGDGPVFHSKKDEMPANDLVKKDILNKLKSKILARLKAAERLLENDHAHDLIGDEYESVLDSIYQLRKIITKTNKTSRSGRLFSDLIIREGNKLSRDGFFKGANYLYKIAQMPGGIAPGGEGTVALPNLTPDPTGGVLPTNPGDATTGGETQPQPEPNPEDVEDKDDGVDKFISKLNGDELETDSFEVDFEEDVLEVNDSDIDEMVEDIVVTAQTSGSGVTPERVEPKGFDDVFESALGNVTIKDVISKVEQLSKLFKTREIPRQLSIVDLMLNKLDMANYFPELSEATNKSLESNNYVSTRIDSILARLYSALNSKPFDLTQQNNTKITSPEVDALKRKLNEFEESEKLKGQLKIKKQVDDLNKPEIEVEQNEAPTIEVEEAPAPAPTQQR